MKNEEAKLSDGKGLIIPLTMDFSWLRSTEVNSKAGGTVVNCYTSQNIGLYIKLTTKQFKPFQECEEGNCLLLQ